MLFLYTYTFLLRLSPNLFSPPPPNLDGKLGISGMPGILGNFSLAHCVYVFPWPIVAEKVGKADADGAKIQSELVELNEDAKSPNRGVWEIRES